MILGGATRRKKVNKSIEHYPLMYFFISIYHNMGKEYRQTGVRNLREDQLRSVATERGWGHLYMEGNSKPSKAESQTLCGQCDSLQVA